MGRLLTDAPRWLLLATLVSAPLLYGSTREWTIHVLIGQLLAIAALWITGSCLSRRRPEVRPPLLIIGGYLVFQAWWMALNAKYVCDPETVQFTSVSAFLPAAPGSIDRRLSLETALLVTGLVCATWLASGMAATSVWRRRLLFSMAATGIVIACLGAVQRVTGATAIYWSGEPIGQSFFGTFRNHDNAAAFINLTWPLTGGLLVAALSGGELWRRILWGAGMVVGMAGVLVSGSRTGALIACILVIALGVWCFRQTAAGRMGNIRVPELVAATVLLLILMGAIAVFTGVDFSLQRWAALEGELTAKNYRYNAYQVCLKMVPEAGWFGFGPGTFQCAFPYFTHEFGDALKGKWIHAHEDYLQTLIEWGYTGGLAWALFVGGAVVVSSIAFAKNRWGLSFNRRAQFAAMLLAISGVLLHALVDFPLQIPSIQLYVSVMLGLLWNAPRWMEHSA